MDGETETVLSDCGSPPLAVALVCPSKCQAARTCTIISAMAVIVIVTGCCAVPVLVRYCERQKFLDDSVT